MAKNQTQPKKTCAECERTIVETNFYKCESSPLFPDKRFHICSKCLGEMMDRDDGYEIALMALHAMNKPMLVTVWNNSGSAGKYFRQINSLPNYKGLTWKNSDFDDNTQEYIKREKKIIEIDDEVIEKYGSGYTNEEYRAFERKYKKLTKNYTEQTAMHSEGLISYIRFRVKEEMATARGDSKESKEWATMAQKAAQDAKLNVSQLSKSDISGGVDLLTQLGEAIETKLSVIPLLPKVLEQPYDDADLMLWANVDYNRLLEDKPRVAYRDIWGFYDEMLGEHFKQRGLSEDEIKKEKEKRNNVFRDLGEVYKEPLYEEDE